MQIIIKPICDWPIYLAASAAGWLACITQTSFHSTTLLWIHFLQPWHKIELLPTPFLHTPQALGPLTFLFHSIFHTTI